MRWVDAEGMSVEEAARELERADGVLVPGGFGSRGWEGKITACRIARERGIPISASASVCTWPISEFARNVVGLDGANSTEMDPETPYPVIDLLPEQKEIEDLGGTMRLGADAVDVEEGTRTHAAYGEAVIHERHRHRYEVNNALPAAARRRRPRRLRHLPGGPPGRGRSSCPTIPWFVASQYHPEFKSRPTRPAPLFRDFVGAAFERARARTSVGKAAAPPRIAPWLPPGPRGFSTSSSSSPPSRALRERRRRWPSVIRSYLGDLGLAVEDDEAGNLLARLKPAEKTAAARSSSARTWTRCLRSDRSSRSSAKTASSATRRARSSAPTTRRPWRCSSSPRACSSPKEGRTRGSSSSSQSKEEVGLEGRQGLRPHAPASKLGFVYDCSGPVGGIVRSAPYGKTIDVVFKGRSAHAGLAPEEGRSAIAAAGRRLPTSGSAGSTRRRLRTSG